MSETEQVIKNKKTGEIVDQGYFARIEGKFPKVTYVNQETKQEYDEEEYGLDIIK